MGSIYNISLWSNTVDYGENDIVVRQNRFYYAFQPSGPATNPETPNENSAFWGGVITVPPDPDTKTYFFWKPSYSINVSHAPKVKSIKYGDGYEQRMKDGINNDLLSFSLKFKNINEKQATAIIHFLTARSGSESFYFMPPAPYSVYKKFVCKSFSSDNPFVNNFSVSVKFQEVT